MRLFDVFRRPAGRVVRGVANNRAYRIMEALARPMLEPAEQMWRGRIEAVRAELLRSADPLSWNRPWLAKSAELRGKLGVKEADGRFAITLTTGEATKASRPPRDCEALLALVGAVQPASVLEMGTNVGISGAYIAAGLAVAGQGRLVTLEGAPAKGELARTVFARLGLHRAPVSVGDFAETLDSALQDLAPVDLAFIDGFHEQAATLRYHARCKAYASPGAVLVYDDIRWSEGMQRAWRTLTADPDVALAVDYGAMGVCVLA